ncbi:MAG: glycosyltransferase N-terminal domain-containing protein [Chitinophagales bacterium]
MKILAVLLLLILCGVLSLLFLQAIYYSIIVRLYHLGIWLVSPFIPKARQWVQGRKHLFETLSASWDAHAGKKYWIHCASLGEFEQGRSIIELLKKQEPDCKILLTFYSPSGYLVRKDYAFADFVCYLPADTPANAKKFLSIVRPDVVLFIKYEFWYHHIRAIYKQHIPLYLVSGVFRKKQLFFKWYGRLHKQMLRMYTCLFVQDKHSLDLLHSIHMQHAAIAFDTRFDRVLEVASKKTQNEVLDIFCPGFNIIVAGSTWKQDERVLRSTFYAYLLERNFKIIVAPHNIDKRSLKRTKRRFKKYMCTYSEALQMPADELERKRVLILDNMGMLSSVYAYADLCYIGGGFAKGIHNTLEAAVYGKPLFFGPNYKKFTEAVGLVESNAAFVIADAESFMQYIALMNDFKVVYRGAAKDALTYVREHAGGTDHIVAYITGKSNIPVIS